MWMDVKVTYMGGEGNGKSTGYVVLVDPGNHPGVPPTLRLDPSQARKLGRALLESAGPCERHEAFNIANVFDEK